MLGEDTVADVIEALFAKDALPALEAFVAIPSLSPAFDRDWEATGALDAAAAHLAAYATSRPISGLSVETLRLPHLSPVVLVEIPPSPGGVGRAATLVYGHLDKQPPLGEWREGLDPFRATLEGDRLYGRGAADDGYALFSALSGIEALRAAGGEHGPITILLEASEESGSPDLPSYLDLLAKRLGSPALVLCLDSGCQTYDRLWATTSLRGVLVGTLHVEVMSEGIHSGEGGGVVPSSFRIARALLSRIEDETTGEIVLPALRTSVPATRREEIAAVAQTIGNAAAGTFPLLSGVAREATTIEHQIGQRTWSAALAVVGQDGLPPSRDGGNVLLPGTHLKLSIRLPPNLDADEAAEAVRRALEADPPSGAHVRFDIEHPAQGWEQPPIASWLAAAIDTASHRRFGNPPAALGLGGSIPFLAELGRRYPGTQFLATGVLGPESNAHGLNEFLHIPTAKAIAGVVADVLAAVPPDGAAGALR